MAISAKRLVFGEPSSSGARKATDSISLKDQPDDLFVEIDRVVQNAKKKVEVWKQNQEKFYRMRMRIKKRKDFPFANSSNLRMPTVDTQIKKVKAAIMQQIFGVRPVVQAIPGPNGTMDDADKIEKFLDHLIMDVIEVKNKAEICVDQSIEKGFYVGKAFFRKESIERDEVIDLDTLSPKELQVFLSPETDIQQLLTEVIRRLDIDMEDSIAEDNIEAVLKAINKLKSGKKNKVDFKVRDITYNFPDVDFISPERVFVPTDSGFDVQKANSVTVEFFLPIDYIKKIADSRGWDISILNDLPSLDSPKQEQLDLQKDFKEGIERLNNPSSLVKIHETYGMFDIDRDGTKELSFITTFPDFHAVVRKVKLRSHTYKYNLVKFFYELTQDRWFAHRGIPEILEDIIKEIDVQHNMKIDSQTMRNFPMIVYRSGMINPRKARVNPAAGIPVQGLQPLDDTIKAINLHNPNAEFSYEREQMILETKIQEFVGQVDFSLQSLINRRQPRTLGEVEEQSRQSGGVFSLDAGHYIDSFSQLFQMIYDLWSEFGPDTYEFNYFGQNSQPTKIKLTKEEIQGKYKIKIRGNDANTNPQIKLQKAQQIILASTNPVLIQMGVVGPQQMAEGLKRFYQALDIHEWENLVNVQPQPQQPDPRTAIEPKFDEMTDSEQAQVLNAYGIEADAPGRQRKQVMEGAEIAADIASKIGEEPDSGIKQPKQPKSK